MSILIGLYVYLFPFKTHGSFFNNWLSICFFLQFSLMVAIYLEPIVKIKNLKKNIRVKSRNK
jgi:hypothetical protein